jgi:hypothetical protein
MALSFIVPSRLTTGKLAIVPRPLKSGNVAVPAGLGARKIPGDTPLQAAIAAAAIIGLSWMPMMG